MIEVFKLIFWQTLPPGMHYMVAEKLLDSYMMHYILLKYYIQKELQVLA